MQYIPTSFLKTNQIKLNSDEEMIVRDQNGRMWPMQIKERKDGRFYLSSGWIEFREKNLRLGNQCMFEFVLGEGNTCSETIARVLPRGLKIEKNHFVMKA